MLQLLGLTGAALSHSARLLTGLQVNAQRMAHNVAASHGTMLAEALSFALATFMPREAAKALVRDAAVRAAGGEGQLVALVRADLSSRGDPIDWAALTESRTLGVTSQLIGRSLAHYAHVRGPVPLQEQP